MQNPTDRIAHTIAFVIPVVEHWLDDKKHYHGGISLMFDVDGPKYKYMVYI